MRTHIPHLLLRLLLVVSIIIGLTLAQNLTTDQISTVKSNLANGASNSWEYGTRAQALLDIDSPSYSVFSSSSPFFSQSTQNNSTPSSLTEALSIAQSLLTNLSRSSNYSLTTRPQALYPTDTSAADPCSVGPLLVLANLTQQPNASSYTLLAQNQLAYLFSSSVPKTSDGAFSHRLSQVQLWSDFVSMVPPFLAAWGVSTGNQSAVEEAYNQISLYRSYLRDDGADGLWKHIVQGSGQDEGHWSTGNGWAAAGMLRVLATIKYSPWSSDLSDSQSDLADWVQEIHTGMFKHLQDSNLFLNYADSTSDSNFEDAASSALIASTVYRLATLDGRYTHLPQAEQIRQTLMGTNSSGAPSHLTSSGWLTPVVNPYSYGSRGSQSPEAQAFVLEMEAAWTEWVAQGSQGANAAVSGHRRGREWWVGVVLALGVGAGFGL